MWSREVLTDFINLYKSLPCLWKVNDNDYRNKILRDSAYNKLVEFCKVSGFPEANREFVCKKLQSLRGSFRKELKKIRDSCHQGVVTEKQTPSLWYYDLLLFIKDQESLPSLDGSEKEFDAFEDKYDGYEDITKEILVYEAMCYPRKRKTDAQAEFSDIFTRLNSTNKTNSQSMSDNDAFAKYISRKLSKMDPTQVILAESLISGVIRRGLLKNLTEETNFCENGCHIGKNLSVSPL